LYLHPRSQYVRTCTFSSWVSGIVSRAVSAVAIALALSKYGRIGCKGSGSGVKASWEACWDMGGLFEVAGLAWREGKSSISTKSISLLASSEGC
jgi:hypothetical protein